MIKILFLTPTSLNKYSGIDKKVLSQYNAFKKNDLNIELCFLNKKEDYTSRNIYGEKENILISFKSNNKYLQKFFNIYLSYNFNDVYMYILRNNINFVYIRYVSASNYSFIKFLKKLKKRNIKILIEIPTYPYDLEISTTSFKFKMKYLIEKHYRKYLKRYVDRIITFSIDDEIYGIKTIKINNGIDIDDMSLIVKEENNEINFIGVAGIAFWHGFDRFILSMIEYYKDNPFQKIKFHIVGDGDKKTLNDLKRLVEENNLKEYVIFYGYKSGKELDEIYNKSDIAVGSLGGFRRNIYYGSSLKAREYSAKGLPFILAEEDLGFKNCPFLFKVSNDNSLININEIIKKYKNLKMTPEEIRKYAEENLTWDKQMKKIINYIISYKI